MTTTKGRPWTIRAGAVLLAIGVLTGCSANSSSTEPGRSGGAAAPQNAEGGQADAQSPGAAEGAARDSGDAGPAAVDPATGGLGAAIVAGQGARPRKVSRAEVAVTVDDLTKASATVRGLAGTHGGYVSSESVAVSEATSVDNSFSGRDGDSAGYPDRRSDPSNSTYPTPPGQPYPPDLWAQPGEARIVLRVAPDQTEAVMDAIAGAGEEISRWRTDTDVELQLVDLDSRIATQTQSIADLRLLMAKATTVGEIIAVEQEISSRTANLESLKAQQASLSDAAAYSTVTAVLRTPERSAEAESEAGFLGGLKAGWNALARSVRVILTFIGAVLPFAVVALLIGYPVRRWLRPRVTQWRDRRRQSRTARQQQQLAHFAAPEPAPPQGPGSSAGHDLR